MAAGFPQAPTALQWFWAILASLLSGFLALYEVTRSAVGPPARSETAGVVSPTAKRSADYDAVLDLPPDIADFVGRAEELGDITSLLSAPTEPSRQVATCYAVAGQGGVGKTALTVRAAHELRPCFPDGQFYVNLRGVEAERLDPATVLDALLRALGVDGSAIPPDIEHRTALYRSRLQGQRVLILLDNAASEHQIRPLLPEAAGCAAIVTSRSPLGGIAATRSIRLRMLPGDEAVRLLRTIVGAERIAAEPEMAVELVNLCGCLPLAIKIAGAKLRLKGHWKLSRLVERLGHEHRRLDELSVADLEVRASFRLSYKSCDSYDRRAFRTLGLLVGVDFAVWSAAALLGVDDRTAEDILERLVDAQLIEFGREDLAGQSRYQFHDLLRDFARERARKKDAASVRTEALSRFLASAVGLAGRASARLPDIEYRHDPRLDALELDSSPLHTTTRAPDEKPMEWLMTEQDNLALLVEQASDNGAAGLCWKLAFVLAPYYDLVADWDDWLGTHETALEAARRSGDLNAEGLTRYNLGRGYAEQGRWREGIEQFDECLRLFEQAGSAYWRAASIREIAIIDRYRSEWRTATPKLATARELFRSIDSIYGEATCLVQLGISYRYLYQWPAAIDALGAAIRSFEDLREPYWLAYGRRNLGDLWRYVGKWEASSADLNDALTAFEDLGNRRWAARTLRSLGDLERDRGAMEDAEAYLLESIRRLDDLRDRIWHARAVRSLGLLRRRQGRLSDALDCFSSSAPVFQAHNDLRWMAISAYSIGTIRRDLEEWTEAEALFDDGREIFTRLDDRLWIARTDAARGLLAACRGNLAAAQELWTAAFEILHELDMPERAQVSAALRDPDGACAEALSWMER